jgi:cell division protein FtsW
VNIASDIGVFPVVGVTLPFISYGGSSLIANFLAIAFVINVLRRDPEVKAEIENRRQVRRVK